MLIDAIADYLAAEGLGTVGTNIFVGFLPAAPDTALAIFPTGGLPASGGEPLDEPTFQVRSRSASFLTAHNNAQGAYNALHGLHHATIGGHYVLNCLGLQSGPTSLGRDEAGRDELVVNFLITVRSDGEHRGY